VRILTRSDIERVLDYPSCIEAVEDAFRIRGRGENSPSAVLGVHARDGGFHVKAAALRIGGRDLFAAKINANFPANPSKHALPTIQGMLGLFDAHRGVPLALMDSMSVTTIRTASATAVAARHLALPGATSLAVIGCGMQALPHVSAIHAVRPLASVVAYDIDAGARHALATSVRKNYGILTTATGSVESAVREADIVVTCTPAKSPILDEAMLRPGTFVGAVGADNEHKSEIAPSLMASAVVIVDDLEQCATIGDLHHAIAARLMARDGVRASLGDVVVDASKGRRSPDEVIIFDSTGVAIEDVAAAAVAWQRAESQGIGSEIALAG
jgi:alanine dehydrogenase